jgi:hypothetical protein
MDTILRPSSFSSGFGQKFGILRFWSGVESLFGFSMTFDDHIHLKSVQKDSDQLVLLL